MERETRGANVVEINTNQSVCSHPMIDEFAFPDWIRRIVSSIALTNEEAISFLDSLKSHQNSLPPKVFAHALETIVKRIDRGETLTPVVVQFVFKSLMEDYQSAVERSLDTLSQQAAALIKLEKPQPDEERHYQKVFSEFIESYGWIPEDDKRFQTVLECLSMIETRYKQAGEALDELMHTALIISNDDRQEDELRDELHRDFQDYTEQYGWRLKDDHRFREVIRILQHLYKHAAFLERKRAAEAIREDLAWLKSRLQEDRLDEIHVHIESKREFFEQMERALFCSYLDRIFPSDIIGGIHVNDPAPEYYQLKEILQEAKIVLIEPLSTQDQNWQLQG